MDSRQTSAVPGLPQNASSRAGLGNLKRLGSSRGRLDVKVRTVSMHLGAALSRRRSSVFSPSRGQLDVRMPVASGNGHMCRARWLLHYRYLSCLLCCALHLLLQDKMVLFSPAREGEHLKATPQDQKQTSNTPAGPCQCSCRHSCCLSLQSVEITLTVPQTPPELSTGH